MFGKIAHTFSTRILAALLNLLIAIVISRVLGPEGKGQQGILLATIAYILVFSNLMGGSAIVYLVPRISWAAVVLPAYMWALITSVFFYFILKFFRLTEDWLILHVCILSFINALTTVNTSVLIGREKIQTANAVSLIQPALTVSLLLIFFYLTGFRTIEAYIVALYVAMLVSLAVSSIYIWTREVELRLQWLRDFPPSIRMLFRYGLLNQLAHVFQLISFRLSYFWLEQTWSLSEVGVYSNGTTLAESIWLIARSISTVQYARIANTDDVKSNRMLTSALMWVSLLLSFGGLLVLWLIPSWMFVKIFGDGFQQTGVVIRSLSPGILAFTVALIVGHYFSGTGRYHINTLASFVGMVAMPGMLSLLVPSGGITGAGWASSISYTLTAVVVLIFYFTEKNQDYHDILPSGKFLRQTFLSGKKSSEK